MTKVEKRLDGVEQELIEIKGLLQQLIKPSDINHLYIKELARKVAAGDRQALKEHNRLKKMGLI